MLVRVITTYFYLPKGGLAGFMHPPRGAHDNGFNYSLVINPGQDATESTRQSSDSIPTDSTPKSTEDDDIQRLEGLWKWKYYLQYVVMVIRSMTVVVLCTITTEYAFDRLPFKGVYPCSNPHFHHIGHHVYESTGRG